MAVLTEVQDELQAPIVPETPTLDDTEVTTGIDDAYGSGLLGGVSDELPTWETPAGINDQVTDGASYVTPESTVTGQLESLLNSDSPYMQQVANRSREEANKLGLLSSSMSVGAGQRAAIESAIPIATKDAETFRAFQQKEQDTEYDISKDLISTQLNADYIKYKGEVDTIFQGAMKAADAKTQALLAKSQTEWNAEMNFAMKDFDNQWQAKLANGQVSQERYDNAMTSIGQITQNTSSNIAALLADPDISSMDADVVANMLNSIQAHSIASIEFVSGVGGINADELQILIDSFSDSASWSTDAVPQEV